MPGLTRHKVNNNNSSTSSPSSTCSSSSPLSNNCYSNSIWTRSHTEDVSFSQLQKFWNGLPADARRALLRIDKQALFEQVRKNLYCSRCHGLLVEGFSQIITYGKNHPLGRGNTRKVFPEAELGTSGFSAAAQDEKDPSLHPWGGLAATRDSALTVLDCFLDGASLEVLQNVFESARGRERERELLYPDACGGNGRGWISSQSSVYSTPGRGHGMKETCALHTARLPCEALVDFWSALSEETRRSLLRMKEEDFIERLMFRFDSKRFCRDCRRNVLREFKEMKELKRSRKETRCTRWFCAADSAFQYEVSDNTLVADWRDSFAGDVGNLYEHFEWALGTGDGKDDIFGFEDVGLSHRVEVEGLELSAFPDCFITIRAWRRDGRCSELSVKAHGLKGELCVHRRLFVGDGFVSITEGESIQRFFEHAEETEDEEDEDAFDRDGNEVEGEGSRLQKHAKSPELARDFLLDAATVIFKEQVEKAFREGTARQNAHSIFVCLALGLLEDRVRVACKEIATLEKQNKLLEEEEHEKREEEERRERRKLKEKEKKQRRKEKLKNKELREKEKVKNNNGKGNSDAIHANDKQQEAEEEPSTISETPETRPISGESCSVACSEQEAGNPRSCSNGSLIVEHSKAARRRESKRQQQVTDAPMRHLRRTLGMGGSDSALQERQSNARNECACTTSFRVKAGDQLQSRDSPGSNLLRKPPQLRGRLASSTAITPEAQKLAAAPNTRDVRDENNENGVHSENGGAPANDSLSERKLELPPEESGEQQQEEEKPGCTTIVGADAEADTCSSSTDTNNESLELETNRSESSASSNKTKEEEGSEASSTCSPTSVVAQAPAPAPASASSPAPASGIRVNAPAFNSNGFVPVKNPYGAVLEMLPQIRHHPPVHHHHHPPMHHQQFVYHPQHHHHPVNHWSGARGNLMRGPVFIPGPPAAAPATLGFPRFSVPPRVFHPQMRVPEMVHSPPPPPPPPPPRPGYVPWVPRPSCLEQQPVLHQHHHQAHQQQQQHRQKHVSEIAQQQVECEVRNSSGFSLFHFGGARSSSSPVAAAAAASSEVMQAPEIEPVCCPSGEKEEDEVVVSSKCMDRLPSGIAMGSMMGGEYRLFAAAPGKVFGFF